MAKIRIYQWAKENHIQSAEIVKILNKNGYKVRNHTSTVEESLLEKHFKKPNIAQDKFKEKEENKKEENKIEKKVKIDVKSSQKNEVKNNNFKKDGKFSRDKTIKKDDKPSRNNFNKDRNNFPKKNTPQKSEEVKIEETKKKTKKVVKAKPKAKYDRFKMFDKKEKVVLNDDTGKTKTQLKKEAREKRQEELSKETTNIKWLDDMTVAKFATLIDVPVTDIIAKLFELGFMATVNQTLSRDVAEVLTDEYNIEIQDDEQNIKLDFENLLPDFSDFKKEKRPPVVTIMGHVDHGKTTLLDYLRNSNVTAKEAGGITQHIGAYQVEIDGKKITFLDTPGHAAFTQMRARGADITDIIILVVSADDGIMPQTIEAIEHAKAAKSPIIVAINKIDKPDANPDKILGELAEHGLQPEEWGGDIPVVRISALKGLGIEELVEYIYVIADLHNYQASFKGRGVGTVIEAHLDKGKGAVATILLQEGKISLKDPIIIGNTWGSIRVMQDEYGKRYKTISPSTPVEITGLKEVPESGDLFFIASDAKQAQDIGEKRAQSKLRKERGGAHAMSLEELNNLIEKGEIKELPVIIKSDVRGSSEALAMSLEKIEVGGVKVRVVSKGVGAINESDVLIASANNTVIIGFNVRPDAVAKKKIEKEKISLILNNVIYKIIEQIEDSMMGMKEKKYTEEVIGKAIVKEVFKISNIGKVAGAVVEEGKITRESKMRLVREGIVLYDGEIGQLKRYKDDVKEVIEGQDCGISFKNYADLKSGDELEAYKVEEVIE